MPRSASISSSASSQETASAGEAASSGETKAVDPVAPPRVATTARRHVAAHTSGDGSSRGSLDDHTIEHLAGRAASSTSSGLPLLSQGTPRSLPSPATSRGCLRAHRVSSAKALRQRLQSTLAITDAEAARAARTFSMNMYRELHQRKFASQHEELDFLRKDFVASRRTLAVLHGDNSRLQRELLDHVREVEELREKLAEAYRGEEPQHTTGPSPRSSASAMLLPSSRRGSPATSSRRSSSGGPREPTVMWADPPTHQPEEEVKETASAATAAAAAVGEQSGQRISADARALSPVVLPRSGNATAHTQQQQQQQRTPLSLYAKTTVKRSGLTSGASTEVDLRELVRDLRANLARRDTALDESQMILAALRNESQQLRSDLHLVQADAAHAKQQRDEQQRAATAAQERSAAQEKELSECRSALQEVTKEKDAMQQKLTTAELLCEHAGGVKADGAATPNMHLREQLQMYRAKWQTAEDEVEHLHLRLSQLQLQLLRQGGRDGGSDSAFTVTNSTSEKETESGRLLEVTAQQRAEHATELAELRRQHQEQLRLHAEEIQRVQRRLDRAQESATFHEDQLRQQRQDDSRVHHNELQALQTQLRTAQTELVQAQRDREHLARQLRRSTEQETTVEVLRGQVEQLKQRMAEVGADLAQGRGREKETQLLLQRERLARVKAEHDAEVAIAAHAQAVKEVRFLQEEVSLLREQLGMQEASAVPPERKTAGEEEAVRNAVGGGTAGDAAALASELKGYVSLMRVNATLQRRIEELEAEVALLQTSMNTTVTPAAAAAAAAPPPPQPFASPPTALEVEQQVLQEALRRELDDSLQAQQRLAVSQAAVEKERQVLAQDNATLASGVELLQRRLGKAQAALIAEQARRRHASRQRSADKKKEKRRRRDASIVPPPQETSRVRRRLLTARAQDQESVHGAALKDRIAKAAASPDREGTASCHHAPCCCCCRRCSSSSPASAPATLRMFCHHHYHQDVATLTPPPPSMSASSPSLQAIDNGVATSPTVAGSLENTAPSPAVSLNPPLSPSPQSTVSVSTPPSPSGATAAAPSTVSIPPPLINIAVEPAKAPTRCDAASSPLHRPRQHVYGSVLPPVLYPSLVLKTLA